MGTRHRVDGKTEPSSLLLKDDLVLQAVHILGWQVFSFALDSHFSPHLAFSWFIRGVCDIKCKMREALSIEVAHIYKGQ